MTSVTTRRLALVLGLLVAGGVAMTPAFGDEHGNQGQGHNKGGEGARGFQRDRHDNRNHRNYRRDEHNPYYPYMYAQPVYAPPPVYYPPMPTPGVSLFFPIELR